MLDVQESPELQATILSLRQMDTALRRDIFKSTRSELVPEWKQNLFAGARSHLEERVIAQPSRVDVTAENVRLKAAASKKKLSGGASPAEIGHAVEFGAQWRRGEVNARSSKGKPYRYSRRLNKQFKPRRARGYLAWPTAMELVPRFASLWVQTTVRLMHEAFERKL